MKSISKILMIYGIATVMSFSAEAQNRVTVIHNKYAHKGDSVYVELMVDLNNANIPRNAYVLLTPAIKQDSMLKELPSVIINGKKRVTAYRRLVALDREPVGAGMVIHMGEKNTPQSHNYSIVVPFESWMKEADFSIREDQCECNGPLVKMSFDLMVGRMQDLNPIIEEPKPLQLMASFKEPNPEPVKTRSETGKAYINFALGNFVLNSNYMNNNAELAKIGEVIEKFKNDPEVTITHIIDGYSSPDGSVSTNLTLSGKRAATLRDFISFAYDINKDKIRIMEHGEDWTTFEKLLAASDVAYKEQVFEIIRSTSNLDEREKKLKALNGGASYKDMTVRFFQNLRRSDYELQYTVIPFTVEEGKKKLESNPSLLSLNEMYLIAGTYPVGSDEYQHVINIAAKTFPNNDIANINAAANALTVNDIDAAQKFLEKVVNQDDAYWNNLGMLTAMQGNHDQAAGHFRKAVEGGNDEAVQNLAEIEKVKKPLYTVNN